MSGNKTVKSDPAPAPSVQKLDDVSNLPQNLDRLYARSDSLARLKARLIEFWNSQSVYWSPLAEEPPDKPGIRARAASFIPDGSRVLDVACGRAANSIWVLDRGQYFGSDISFSGLRHVQREGLCLTCADAEALPFADGCFDAVLSTYALEHSVNPVQMLREISRVVRPGGRIILLGPTWDLPFWYPNSVQTRAASLFWRLRYTLSRAVAQTGAQFGGSSPFLIIENPDAFTQPFVYDSDAVYVVWSFEVIRQLRRWGCKLIHFETDDRLLGDDFLVRLVKRGLMILPAYRHAGSTSIMVFER